MYIKGASRRSVGFWARHLQDTKENLRADIIEKRGLAADDLRDMMLEMEQDAHLTRCKNFMYIASFNPCPHEHPTERQWEQMYEIFEKHRGIPAGQQRIVIEHEKEGRIHRHVVWNRIDLENMRAFPDGKDAKICDAAEKEIELELGLEQTPGFLDREPGTPPPPRGPKSYEMYRGMKSGLDPRDIATEVTAIFRESEHAADFVEGLRQHGYALVQGRRAFCILDSAGQEHSLAKRIDGINTKELRAFMQGFDLSGIPTVEQGKAQYQERKQAERLADLATVQQEIAWEEALAKAAIEKEKIERRFVEPKPEKTRGVDGREKEVAREERQQPPAPELGKTQGEIRLARRLSHGPQGFANALEDRGFILARVTAGDIEKEMAQLLKEWEERRLNPQTWMEHEGGFAALTPELQASARRSFDKWEKGREINKDKNKDRNRDQEQKKFTLEDYTDFVQEKWREGPKSQLERATGELAVITPFGSIYTLTPRNTGLDREELPEYLKGIDRAPLLTVTDAQSVLQDVREHRREEWLHNRREEWLAQQPLGRTSGEIRLAYSLTQTGQGFADALEDRGLILARTTDADAERLNRWERQRLKEEWKAPAPEKTGKAQRKERAPEDKYRAGELVVVNQYGQIVQLTQHNTGRDDMARAEHLKDIDRAALLSVTAAQGVMKNFQQQRQEEKQKQWQQKREDALWPAKEKHWPVNPPQPERKSWTDFENAATEAARDARPANLYGEAARVWEAWRQIDPAKHANAFAALDEYGIPFSVATDAKAFAAALDEKGITLARATKEEADRSHREAQFAGAGGRYSPRFKEGEIVIISEARRERRREGELTAPRSRVHRLDQSLAEKFVKALGNSDKLQGIDATRKVSDQRAQQRAADWNAIRLERATNIRRGGRARAGNTKDNLLKSTTGILKPITLGLNVIGKPLEILENAFESLFAPKLTPEQIRDGEIAARERQADAREEIDFSNATARRAEERRQLENEREAERQRHRERDVDRER